MKRFWMIALTGALAFTLAGCSGGQAASTTGGATGQGESQSQVSVSGTPEEILALMQQDFNDTAQELYDKQAELFETVGDTYEGYVEHLDAVKDWYALTVSETEALGERTQENSRAYFQSVINSVDPEDTEALRSAIEDYYDAIYEDAYGDYYDAVYDDLYSDAYDQFYAGLISDAYDTHEYNEISEAASSEYECYSDNRSDVYEAISDARSEIYDISSDAWSAFYDDEFTMDEIFRDPVVNVEKNEE